MRTTALVWLLFAPFCASHGQSTSAGAPAQSARSAIFLFGPAGAEAARQAARTAVAVSRHWLSQPGSAAELRRSGSVDALPLDAKIPAKSIEPWAKHFSGRTRPILPVRYLPLRTGGGGRPAPSRPHCRGRLPSLAEPPPP